MRRVGNCEVDLARAEIRRGAERTPLTAIELKMLGFFLRHPGCVVSRAQVIEDVWGREVFVTDRVVDTHILKLRRKIETDPPRRRHIVGVRGLRYRFEP